MKKFKTIRKIMLLPFLFFIVLLASVSVATARIEDNFALRFDTGNICYVVDHTNVPMVYHQVYNDSVAARQDLIEEVRKFISKSLNKKYASHINNLTELLVDKAIGNDMDLTFVLAQTQIETAFGTTGIGRSKSKKSLFGISKKYRTYEESIDHYISVLKKNYLTGNKTEQHLMRNYVNKSGHRYAGDRQYESRLRAQYRDISRHTKIPDLQKLYKELIN